MNLINVADYSFIDLTIYEDGSYKELLSDKDKWAECETLEILSIAKPLKDHTLESLMRNSAVLICHVASCRSLSCFSVVVDNSTFKPGIMKNGLLDLDALTESVLNALKNGGRERLPFHGADVFNGILL